MRILSRLICLLGGYRWLIEWRHHPHKDGAISTSLQRQCASLDQPAQGQYKSKYHPEYDAGTVGGHRVGALRLLLDWRSPPQQPWRGERRTVTTPPCCLMKSTALLSISMTWFIAHPITWSWHIVPVLARWIADGFAILFGKACNGLFKQFQYLFGWTTQARAFWGNDDRSIDQNWVRHHSVNELVIV